VGLPLASPGPIARAIWEKVPPHLRDQHAGKEMANYLALLTDGVPNSGTLALAVTTTSLEPKCFLTSRDNSLSAIPRIELIHSIGNYVVALGQVDDLHGHSFAFVSESTGQQLPSTFLAPATGAASAIDRHPVRRVPTAEAIQAHYARNGILILVPSNVAGEDTEVADMCMIPLMWAPYFMEGGTPKATLDKIDTLVEASPEEHRPAFRFMQSWGRYACVAAGPAPPGSQHPSIAIAWRDFPRDRLYTEWADQRFKAVYRIRDEPPAQQPRSQGEEGRTEYGAQMAAAIVKGMQGASEAKQDKEDKFAYHEKLSILAACGLHPDDWDQVPPIYATISQDGRSVSVVRVAMEKEYKETTLAAEFPSTVFLLPQLVSDVKEVKFGWQDSQA
jgi:hypothetical protein